MSPFLKSYSLGTTIFPSPLKKGVTKDFSLPSKNPRAIPLITASPYTHNR